MSEIAAAEEQAAVGMLRILLKLGGDEQISALALLVRLWCYRRDQQHAQRDPEWAERMIGRWAP